MKKHKVINQKHRFWRPQSFFFSISDRMLFVTHIFFHRIAFFFLLKNSRLRIPHLKKCGKYFLTFWELYNTLRCNEWKKENACVSSAQMWSRKSRNTNDESLSRHFNLKLETKRQRPTKLATEVCAKRENPLDKVFRLPPIETFCMVKAYASVVICLVGDVVVVVLLHFLAILAFVASQWRAKCRMACILAQTKPLNYTFTVLMLLWFQCFWLVMPQLLPSNTLLLLFLSLLLLILWLFGKDNLKIT